MSDVMQLCKNYDPKKIGFPVLVSEKLDGVPGVYTKQALVSRQNKPLLGVQWVHDLLCNYIPYGYTVIGEHYERGNPFKYISGRVRKNEPYEEAHLYLFDFIEPGFDYDFMTRYENLRQWHYFLPQHVRDVVHVIPQSVCHSEVCIDNYVLALEEDGGHEGAVVRSLSGKFTLTRSWDSQKIVFDDLLDLRVCGIEEAVSQEGEAKGMIGALYVSYKGKAVKTGAGKMTHTERKMVWDNPEQYIGKICKVKAKVDPTYDKLRQPTFQAWHEDKEEADA